METLPEAVWALDANYPGFKRRFFNGPAYTFVRGATRRNGHQMDLPELAIHLGNDDIHMKVKIKGGKTKQFYNETAHADVNRWVVDETGYMKYWSIFS